MPEPTRRSLLLGGMAASVLIVAGCSSDSQAPEAVQIEPTAPPEPDPNLADELALIGAYAGTIAAFPELRGTLSAIADQHLAHARELGASEVDLTAVVPIPPSAAKAKPAIIELIERERAAAQLRAESTAVALEADAVRALTFIAASESSHIPELQDVRRSIGGGS